ncbi:MAG: C25 family peptidase propeptide domain-containing protein, partial [Bacteroidota bacterium]
MAKQFIVFTLLAYSLAAAQNMTLYPDVKVIESDEQGLTIEFRPQYGANKKIAAEGNTFELPQFKFGLSSLRYDAGIEDIRIRVILLAIPSYHKNAVSVIASDYEMVSSFLLAPVPSIDVIDDLEATNNTYHTKFVSRNNFYPEQIAELKNVSMVKGVLMGNLVITPYQYQSNTKTLKRYSRIVVRVDYGPKEVTNDNSGNADWTKASVLNYSIAKRWAVGSSLKKATVTNSVLAAGTWTKMEVADEGVYKIDAGYLRSVGVDPSSLSSITDIKVFGADGRRIPEDLNAPRPADLPQMAIEYVDKNGNGKFDSEDYILFYGQGITGWNYNPVQRRYSHYVNPYTFSNYYFLNINSSI